MNLFAIVLNSDFSSVKKQGLFNLAEDEKSA